MKIIITESKLNNLALKVLYKEYGNLTQVVKGGGKYYVNQDGLSLFMYFQDEKNGVLYMDHTKFWGLLHSIFNMEYEQMQDILTIWLEETYNLRGYTPTLDWLKYNQKYKIM